MGRSLHIEKENGVYHVINRGNYLFINEGAHRSFENCLFEACVKCGWVLEGFCVSTNHQKGRQTSIHVANHPAKIGNTALDELKAEIDDDEG